MYISLIKKLFGGDNMLKKVLMSAVSFLLILGCVSILESPSAINISAYEADDIIEYEHIPVKMQPCSIIEFIDDTHFVILQGGLAEDEAEYSRAGMPKPKAGLVVTYADDGTAKNHVINVNSEMTVQGLVDAINAKADGAYTVTMENGGLTMKTAGDAVRMEFKNGDVTQPDVEASNITTVMGFDAVDEDAGTYGTNTISYHQTISAGSPSDLNSENYSSIYINEDGIIDVKYGNGDTLSVMQDPDNLENMVFKYTLNNGRIITGDNLTIFNDVVEPANLQIQLASFINPNGLIANGNNTYGVGPNSGMALFGSISSDAFGNVISGVLEGSNVDLASEFAEMVVAQRAIEANSRVFDTTNQILQTLSTLGR